MAERFEMNAIPEMTDPLGRHWDQPRDVRYIVMDDTHCILHPDDKKKFCNYDRSMPSGVYPGKCWLRTNMQEDGTDKTWLVWYGDYDAERTSVSNNYREVLWLD